MKWASLAGWVKSATYEGWLEHRQYATSLRSPDGRWWSLADVAEGRVEMTEDGPRRAPGWFVDPSGRWVPEAPDPADELTDKLRQHSRKSS